MEMKTVVKIVAIRIFVSFFEEILLCLYHSLPVLPNNREVLRVIIHGQLLVWNT